MKAVHFIYNGKKVDFQPTDGSDLMVNATQMAKIFGKQVNEFTSNLNTQNFINECLKNGNSRFLGIENETDLIDSRQKSGTWMHRVLALKFAAWLDPEFELWVYVTIDKILFSHYKELKEATTEKLRKKQLIELKRKELLAKYPEFEEFERLHDEMNDANRKRVRALREATNHIQLELFPSLS